MKITKRAAAALAVVALLMSVFTLSCFATETTAVTDAGEKTTALQEFLKPSVLIPIIILLVALIAFVVVFFILPKRRVKTMKFLAGLKSEWKKITWYTWKQTWKGTVVVAVTSIVIAAVIGILDYGFAQGIAALTELAKAML